MPKRRSFSLSKEFFALAPVGKIPLEEGVKRFPVVAHAQVAKLVHDHELHRLAIKKQEKHTPPRAEQLP